MSIKRFAAETAGSIFDKPKYKALKDINGAPTPAQVKELKALKLYLDMKPSSADVKADLKYIADTLKAGKGNGPKASDGWLAKAKAANKKGGLEAAAGHVDKFLKAKAKEDPSLAAKCKELQAKFNKRWNSGMRADDLFDEFDKL